MSLTAQRRELATPVPWLVVLFWAVMLLVSTLPNILWQETTGQSGAWLFGAKQGLLLALLAVSLRVPRLRVLRPLLVIFLVLYTLEWLAGHASGSALWQGWFGGDGASFTRGMLGIQLLRMGVTLTVIVTLFALTGDRRRFFLARGDLRAEARPVRLLGMNRPIPWSRFGIMCVVIGSIALLLFLVPVARPTPQALLLALPFLPMILLLAAMNAFSEEMSYRAPLLATSESVIGARQALWMSAAYFGLGHYYGVPYGIIGVLMSGFFGYLLGKGMLETRGLFWAWLIHMVADVWIFSFMAIGAVTPGGS
jgi:membrane protease YdiL (CAAX protease family)